MALTRYRPLSKLQASSFADVIVVLSLGQAKQESTIPVDYMYISHHHRIFSLALFGIGRAVEEKVPVGKKKGSGWRSQSDRAWRQAWGSMSQILKTDSSKSTTIHKSFRWRRLESRLVPRLHCDRRFQQLLQVPTCTTESCKCREKQGPFPTVLTVDIVRT